ncbi:transmembrane protein 18 [Kipferlia bialata]|uniref:Transmembrane protein 18 n=1 Tax=Kipferlia bialata TaxID=797122 RepID=A0A9K3CVD1_9EUKA|nr:transmembrane protein 18 [Kipferlia bialata]|eukprot:g5425.t1
MIPLKRGVSLGLVLTALLVIAIMSVKINALGMTHLAHVGPTNLFDESGAFVAIFLALPIFANALIGTLLLAVATVRLLGEYKTEMKEQEEAEEKKAESPEGEKKEGEKEAEEAAPEIPAEDEETPEMEEGGETPAAPAFGFEEKK